MSGIDLSQLITREMKDEKASVDARDAWKADREKAVSAIKVTTKAGNTFDGDELSQGRMTRAILGLQSQTNLTTVDWVLADNTLLKATADELSEALAMAGLEQARLWTLQ